MSDGTGTGRVAVGLAIWFLFVLVGWNLHVVGATGAASLVYASLVLGLICCLLPWIHASSVGRHAPLLRAWHDPAVPLDAVSFAAIAVASIALAALLPDVARQEGRLCVDAAMQWLVWIRGFLTVDMPGLTGFGALLLAFVMSAVAEEILYRGYLQRYVFGHWKRPWAVLFTTLLFTLGHASRGNTLGIFVIGIVLGTAVEITGRVWVSVLMHATLNLVVLALTETGELERLYCPWAWLSLPVLVGALVYLRRHLRRRAAAR